MEIALNTQRINTHVKTDASEDAAMAELKPEIASGYKVDADRVAEAILGKLSLVKSVRRRLGTEADRTPEAPERPL